MPPDFVLGAAVGTLLTAVAMWGVIRRSWDRERDSLERRLVESQQYERAIGEHGASEATMVERCANLRGLIELKERA